jgi:hypothetical protein
MINIENRVRRGLREAVLIPATLGGVSAVLLLVSQWIGSGA